MKQRDRCNVTAVSGANLQGTAIVVRDEVSARNPHIERHDVKKRSGHVTGFGLIIYSELNFYIQRQKQKTTNTVARCKIDKQNCRG